jgi:hypothetical protein
VDIADAPNRVSMPLNYSAGKDAISRIGLFTGIELAPRHYNQAISFFMLKHT